LYSFETIAVAAEVREEDVLPARGSSGLQQLERALIREMSVSTTDPLFQRPRTFRVVFQKLAAVIRFDDDDVTRAHMLAHVDGRVTEIG